MDNGRLHHDLKNELGIVLGFSQVLLAEMDANDPTRKDVAEIHAAAQRAMALIRQLESGAPVSGR
jgi:signal transduction histidine kinase